MYRKFKEISDNELIQKINTSETVAQVLSELGCIDNSYNRKQLREFISLHEIPVDHFKTRISKDSYLKNPKYCKFCGNKISFNKRRNDFCSSSCAASFNNITRELDFTNNKVSYCLNCGKEIPKRNKYCNMTCKAQYEEKAYIERWKNGEESGLIGRDGIKAAVRNYLFNKYNNSCQLCGWNQVNQYTGKIPLQIHHIDGDCTNNKEDNLQLLCPNCHSLTENFGSRNKNCTRIDKRQR